MYRQNNIILVIPAHNEEKLIEKTLRGVPPEFDRVIVVDDCSTDRQNEVILAYAKIDPRVELIRHSKTQGPGGAIITGYKKAAELCDITVVVGADAQMDLSELHRFLDPIIDGKVDYTKGNRFHSSQFRDTTAKMPKIRFFANWTITALTKIASGYYRVLDVVDGYTAISKRALQTVDWDQAWKQYGYPMDFLIRLNAYGFKIQDVPRTAIYTPGERQSQIKGFKYMMKVSPMLFRHFFWRLRFRYLYLDFHPLVLFFGLSFVLLPLGLILSAYLAYDWIFMGGAAVTAPRSVLASLLILSGVQLALFGMFFDMQEGR